jgi:hypothetical protein
MQPHGARTDASSMTSPVLAPTTPSSAPGSWGWGSWLLVIVAGAAEGFVALIATLFIRWGASTSCGDPASMSNVREGEIALILVLCVGLIPWAVAMLVSPQRRRLGVAGALAVSPLIYGMVAGLDPQFWSDGWCF